MNIPKQTGIIKTNHRKIGTAIPVPESQETIKILEQYEPRSMAGFSPVIWDRAEGYRIFDAYGNCWIDFSSAVILANAGHAHEKICEAIKSQIDKKLLHNYCFPSEIRARLVQKLVGVSPDCLEKVLLLSTGSETIECAIKLTRMHGRTISPEKTGIVSFGGSFHGRTMGSQMIGGFDEQKEWIVNLDPDMHQIPFPFCYRCPWGKSAYNRCGEECFQRAMGQLKDKGVGADRTAGFITETFQAPTVGFLPNDYVQAMRQWADEHQILVAFDEIQAGFGRTGKMFGFEYYGVEADLICCGKGMSSCLPVSAVIGRGDLMDLYPPRSMTSTHSGNPLCSAAALASIEIIEKEGLVENAAATGAVLETGLKQIQRKHPDVIGHVSGKGLVYSMHMVKAGTKEGDSDLAFDVVGRCVEKGLLFFAPVGSSGHCVKISPPLCIEPDAVRDGLGALAEAVDEIIAEARKG